MRLGIGELKLRKKGLLPEMQLLAEMHFPNKVILLWTPRTLVPSATKKTARKCQLKPSTSKMNTIQQPNSFDQQRQHNMHEVNA